MDIIIWSLPLFFALMSLEVVWAVYKKGGQYRWGDALSCIGCGIVDQTSGVFSKLLVIMIYVGIFHLSATWRPWDFQAGWPLYVGAFVAYDFVYYWAHRWAHKVNLFWLGHSVHHQSEDYNLAVALRQGAFQKILMAWVYWPLAIVGIPPELFVAVASLNLVYQFWIHTEAIERLGPLEFVLNTPSHHRVHHGRDAEYIDKNHAGVFIVWDRMFGTFQPEAQRPTYGLTKALNSFNPVVAHVHPFAELWRSVLAAPDWRMRSMLIFASPAKLAIDAPSKPMDAPKFDRELPTKLKRTLVIRWASVLVFGVVFLVLIATFPVAHRIIAATWIMGSLYLIGKAWDTGKAVPRWQHLVFDLALIVPLAQLVQLSL